MPKILHAADFHLDSPAGALPPEKAALRRRELLDALNRTITLSNEQSADILLIPGDLFDSQNTPYDTVESAALFLSRAKARVFIAPGNHDYYSTRCPYAAVRWPDNVHIFTSRYITSVSIPELETTVYGAGFDSPEIGESLLSGFSAKDDAGTRIMVLHADLNAAEARYNPISEEQIAASGLDYLALGHTHQFSGIKRAGGTCFAYPGCPEGRGFDETGEKGVIFGEVSRGECDLKFIPLCARRYDILEVSVKDEREALGAALSKVPPESMKNIVRIVFTGETGPEGLDTGALFEGLSDRFFHLFISDETRMRRDVWAQAGEGTLKGLFLRNMQKRLADAPDEKARRLCDLAARFGVAALENRTPPGGEGACL